jgi:hypothetical protein
MVIKTYGDRGYTCQIDRIDQGLIALGHNLTSDIKDAELIYLNDRTSENLEEIRESKAKKIFNVLDIPHRHLTETDIKNWKEKLLLADHVTCISDTVKQDIKETFGIDATVIYNPMKDVGHNGQKSPQFMPYKFCYVGRAGDPNKRFTLIHLMFDIFKLNPSNLAVFGNERPMIGNYYGVIPDEALNLMYNTIPILLFPSFNEGIGLPMIEAVCCGCYPICCTDNKAAREFLKDDVFLAEPTPFSIFEKVRLFIEQKSRRLEVYDKMGKLAEDFINRFHKKNVAERIVGLAL